VVVVLIFPLCLLLDLLLRLLDEFRLRDLLGSRRHSHLLRDGGLRRRERVLRGTWSLLDLLVLLELLHLNLLGYARLLSRRTSLGRRGRVRQNTRGHTRGRLHGVCRQAAERG
jgi:hypothetical protein